ncbi:NAD(P)/FAD-dependent oxidoreductase [Methanosphaera stadtmanae]|uniref:NAD(P)/FAD-dependent oxidoreductase n=1 Tax=Methanosphaera stadtmanae TaxID=2317 RepID=UPI002E79CA40|nr:NAD(P)/FAD-dependent oxidoreductase [Methanosphaera stadtmanae]MEE0489218.1 NAD(P)/FAD-dependent oxidoreductase [Methanosphaera stadtmanae]
MLKTDVVVIGAGPAGSMAAKHAALGGADVVLIDKKSEIGTPKRCAEGVYDEGFKWLNIEPDERWIAQRIYGATLHSPDGNSFTVTSEDVPVQGFILERKIFDKHMAMDAARAGAKIMIKTLVTDIKRNENGFILSCDSIEGTIEVEAKIAICADGPESIMAKKLGINSTTPQNMMSCAQFEMCNVDYNDDEKIEFYLGQDVALKGYAWIFPKGNGVANVGLGVTGNTDKTAYEYIMDFIEKCPATKNAQPIEMNIGGDPINGLIEKIYDDNLLICGDAAGQVNPIEGGGIIEGMLGGMAAGDVAAKAIKEENYSKERLHEYYEKYSELSFNLIETLPAARDIVYSFTDDEYNKIISVANTIDLKNISKRDVLKVVFKLPPTLTTKLIKLLKIVFPKQMKSILF